MQSHSVLKKSVLKVVTHNKNDNLDLYQASFIYDFLSISFFCLLKTFPEHLSYLIVCLFAILEGKQSNNYSRQM